MEKACKADRRRVRKRTVDPIDVHRTKSARHQLEDGLSSAYTPREIYLRGLLKMCESRDHGRVQEVWPIWCQCSRQMSSENVDDNNDNVVPGRTTLYSACVLFNDRRPSSSGSDLQQQREPRRHPPNVDGARRSRLTSSFDAEHSLSPLTDQPV